MNQSKSGFERQFNPSPCWCLTRTTKRQLFSGIRIAIMQIAMESLYIIAIFWPPVAVWLVKGWSRELAENVLFTLLGFYPGIIHAAKIVTEAETSANRVTSVKG